MKHHYVYRITNKEENKHYYGVRSSKVEPRLDLGIKYFSSSTDKEFISLQKKKPEIFRYKVIKTLNTRKDAIEMEIKLHNKFDIAKNENFYNRAKQTSSGFDPYGIKPSKETLLKLSMKKKGRKHTEETKEKIRCKSIGRRHTEETKEKFKNRVLSSETKKKISETKKGTKHTAETKEKMSESRRGEKSVMFGKQKSSETKKKISEALSGRTLDITVKLKISQTLKGIPKPKVECPHCGKKGDIGSLTRWHFNNCKFKQGE